MLICSGQSGDGDPDTDDEELCHAIAGHGLSVNDAELQ